MLKVHFSGKPARGFGVLRALANKGGHVRLSGPLGLCVALPVPRGLEKTLMSLGLADDPAKLGDLARHYLFLGDARILLAESRERLAPLAGSLQFVKQVSTEGQTQTETGVQYQCL